MVLSLQLLCELVHLHHAISILTGLGTACTLSELGLRIDLTLATDQHVDFHWWVLANVVVCDLGLLHLAIELHILPCVQPAGLSIRGVVGHLLKDLLASLTHGRHLTLANSHGPSNTLLPRGIIILAHPLSLELWSVGHWVPSLVTFVRIHIFKWLVQCSTNGILFLWVEDLVVAGVLDDLLLIDPDILILVLLPKHTLCCISVGILNNFQGGLILVNLSEWIGLCIELVLCCHSHVVQSSFILVSAYLHPIVPKYWSCVLIPSKTIDSKLVSHASLRLWILSDLIVLNEHLSRSWFL